MKIIPAVNDKDEWPSSSFLAYQPTRSNMSKPVALLIIIGLFPLFVPVALISLLIIGASHIVELWYQALGVLRE
jgi:hypothetical protein